MPPKPGLYDLKTGLSITTGDSLPKFPDHFGMPIGSAKAALDVVGVGKMAVVLVDFPDRQADSISHPRSEYQSMIFSTNEYPTGSLNDFFIENSYGVYSVDGGAYGWYRTQQPYSYFDDGNYGLYYGGPRVAEAAAALSDPYVDYSMFDSDGPDGIPNSGDDDGVVDAFTVIHAGLGAEETGSVHDIWSHAWAIDFITNDPRAGGGHIEIGYYTIQPEERFTVEGDTLITGISVICHEYGHILGLPDLYDPSRYTWGIGYWGLMGYGAWGAGGNTPESPAHLCSWSKVELGWIDPVNINQNTLSLEFPAVETDPVAYKIWRDGNPYGEYFLIENRQQLGFDTPAPGHGLLIWHYNVARGAYYDRLELEQADGLDELNDGDGNRPDPHYYHDFMGDDSDPYPGSTNNRLFGPDTNPSSDADNGTPTDVIVGSITEIGNTVIADLVIDPETYLPMPTSLAVGFGCQSIILKWRPPVGQIPDSYNAYRRTDGGDWQILNSQPITDSSYTDPEITFGDTLIYAVTAVYGSNESSKLIGNPIFIPDPRMIDYLMVGDTSSAWLNDWYRSILDSLGLHGLIVGDILPYCGETLAELPVLWIVSFPGEYWPMENIDRQTAITDFLDHGGRMFIHDGMTTGSEVICLEYLLYDYAGCMPYPFIQVNGNESTFAQGLYFEFPDTMYSSNMGVMGEPPEADVLLSDGTDCGCVNIVVDRLGFKAVVNSQPLHELLDGPGGTKLEFFNRMLNFFDIETGNNEDDIPIVPSDHLVLSAYPNPFNSNVRLSISSPQAGDLTVGIYDIAGRLVRRFADVGSDIIWDGRGEDGIVAASGIYFARVMDVSGQSSSIKMTLLK